MGFGPDFKPGTFDVPGREMVVGDRWTVERLKIPSYFTAEYYSAANMWKMWKMGFGFPYTGGWAEQPAHIVDAISALEEEFQWHKKNSKL
jgi:hypothetical protein